MALLVLEGGSIDHRPATKGLDQGGAAAPPRRRGFASRPRCTRAKPLGRPPLDLDPPARHPIERKLLDPVRDESS